MFLYFNRFSFVDFSVCVQVRERVPCLHLFQCAGFIVSEHLFDKGLKGFETSPAALSLSAPCFDFGAKAGDTDQKELHNRKGTVLFVSPCGCFFIII